MTDVIVPIGCWSDGSEGAITAWLAPAGALVRKGDLIAEIMNAKTAFEIEAPASGILSIDVEVDEPILVGQVIGQIQ